VSQAEIPRHGCARIGLPPSVLVRAAAPSGGAGGGAGNHGLDPRIRGPRTDLIHRTRHGQTFHAATGVRARAARRAYAHGPLQRGGSIAIRIADAGHRARFHALPLQVRPAFL